MDSSARMTIASSTSSISPSLTVLYATPVVWALLFITGQFRQLVVDCLYRARPSCSNVRYYAQQRSKREISANDANHGATKAMHVMRTNMLSVLTGNDCEMEAVVVVGGSGGVDPVIPMYKIRYKIR
jgi:hypothetical protein